MDDYTPRGPHPPLGLVLPTNASSNSNYTNDELVYLNIGGYKYTTDRETLCKSSNYFSGMLNGRFQAFKKDKDGYIFINRPGKYFEPILEYLITGDVVVPQGMSTKALVRESSFYCIDFPLDETHESLSFVTDSWLADRYDNSAYLKIAHVADLVLAEALKQFKNKADQCQKIETDPFLVKDQTLVNKWLDQTEFGNEYWRFEFIDRQKRLYSGNCTVHDDYFALLNDENNQRTIINYCKRHNLSVAILPVKIHEPGVLGRHYFTVGYKFVHLPSVGSTEEPATIKMLHVLKKPRSNSVSDESPDSNN